MIRTGVKDLKKNLPNKSKFWSVAMEHCYGCTSYLVRPSDKAIFHLSTWVRGEVKSVYQRYSRLSFPSIEMFSLFVFWFLRHVDVFEVSLVCF